MLCGERGISSRLNNGTICSVFLFSFLLFRMIYFKCCFNKWVLLLLLHYSTQYTLLWETVGISWEKSFINSLNIEQNKRLMWATCNHIYQIFLQQKGPACTSSWNTSITWQRMANFFWVSIFTQCIAQGLLYSNACFFLLVFSQKYKNLSCVTPKRKKLSWNSW